MQLQVAKLFTNGQSQAVRLPKNFRFEGKEVYIRKVGSDVILSLKKPSWGHFFLCPVLLVMTFSQSVTTEHLKKERLFK